MTLPFQRCFRASSSACDPPQVGSSSCADRRPSGCACSSSLPVETWTDRWVQSEHKKADGTAGEFKLASGEWFGDAEQDKGVQTSQDARFYAYTSKFTPAFSSVGKDLVVQFSAKHTQKIDCGGAYLKVLPADVDQAKFNGDSEYFIMFGPDVCGTSTKKVHVIFNYKGKNHLIKKEITAPTDQLTHVFTLIVKADGAYSVLIDGEQKQSGRLEEDWSANQHTCTRAHMIALDQHLVLTSSLTRFSSSPSSGTSSPRR